MWYKINQIFNSLRYLVLEISSIEFDTYRVFRDGAGVHKFLWAVYPEKMPGWIFTDIGIYIDTYLIQGSICLCVQPTKDDIIFV